VKALLYPNGAGNDGGIDPLSSFLRATWRTRPNTINLFGFRLPPTLKSKG
jgi:hypothetical protein